MSNQQLNPIQMQIYQHFRSKIGEQSNVLTQKNIEVEKMSKEVPNLVQKIQESELTKGHMDIVEEDAKLYKKVGPAWIEMDKKNIKVEIDGRLELMNKNLKNIENNIKDCQKKGIEAQKNMIRLENEFKYAIAKAKNNQILKNIKMNNEKETVQVTDVEVSFPEECGGTLSSYMRYKVKFKSNGQELSMYRRYSDFEIFRNCLRSYLPFHYIFPLHQKKNISNSNTQMLNDRVEELNLFLEFVLENQELFDCDSFWKFFDSNLKDTKIGQILTSIGKLTWEYREFILKKKYPEEYKIEYSDETEDAIIKFKDRIDLSVNFCKSFHLSIRTYSSLYSESPLVNQIKSFYNLLAIHYSKNESEESIKKVESAYKNIIKENNLTNWKEMDRKSKMICREMSCLIEIYKDFSNVSQLRKNEIAKQSKLSKEKTYLENSDVKTVGFFKKKSKEDKLSDLEAAIKVSEENILIYQRLISFGANLIMKSQLEKIKERKKQRFKETLDKFADSQIERAKRDLELWETIKKENENIQLFIQKSDQFLLKTIKTQSATHSYQITIYLQLFLKKSLYTEQTLFNLFPTVQFGVVNIIIFRLVRELKKCKMNFSVSIEWSW